MAVLCAGDASVKRLRDAADGAHTDLPGLLFKVRANTTRSVSPLGSIPSHSMVTARWRPPRTCVSRVLGVGVTSVTRYVC